MPQMHILLADERLVWRVMNYLQRDAVSQGVKKRNATFKSFWYNMEEFMPAWRENRLYVILDAKGHLMAYFITSESLEYSDREGNISIDIFEVLPKFRRKNTGSLSVSWIKTKACCCGFHSLRVLPVNSSNAFWNKQGFSLWEDDQRYLSFQLLAKLE